MYGKSSAAAAVTIVKFRHIDERVTFPKPGSESRPSSVSTRRYNPST
jgi:hypothetical protein